MHSYRYSIIVSKTGDSLDSEMPEFTYFSKYLSRFLHALIGKHTLPLELQVKLFCGYYTCTETKCTNCHENR